MIGQGYDVALTMNGSKSGVQAMIWEKQPKALYTHCAGHSFNVVVQNSCSIPPIDQIKSLTLFIKKSPKREGLLNSKDSMSGHGRTPLLNVCVTC